MTTTQDQTTQDQDRSQELETNNEVTFAETALRLGGKSEEEARKTGAVDRADEQVESMFSEKFKTVNSPIHKAVWDNEVNLDLFVSKPFEKDVNCAKAMDKCIDVLRRHRDAGSIWDANGKVSRGVIEDLSGAGYWGMLIEPEYGGQGASVQQFMHFLSRVATVDPTTAGLASVHGCIGAVDPVRTFGNAEQKKKFLPKLASGESLSGFALTEPGAGSDLTALKTTAVLDGNDYVVNGEKLFITNAIPGHTVGLVCMIDGKPSALVAELPKTESENFKVIPYGIYALKHAHNNGLVFKNFRIPKENRLYPGVGDGLTIAYHGLNLGRLALCAGASGSMRLMLANILPWAHFRKTYGQAIDTRELVKRRIARTAALIVGADALYNWGSWLLDQGYRGELECIIAKIFGSEAQKEVAIEYFMKTHGGRSFLQGHLFGDNVHDFLAPCIYEGEGEMLGMAFFKALAKNHGQTFFEPVGMALQREGLRTLNPANPAHVFKLRNELFPYAFWRAGKTFAVPNYKDVPGMDLRLKGHLEFALDMMTKMPIELSGNMVKHQLKLADRQCRIADLSQRVQDTVTMIVASLYANQKGDEMTIAAADILCDDLERKLTGKRASDTYFKKASKLADLIIETGVDNSDNVKRYDILFPY
jgi:alkylation response protein AidB-like acyl-CoA dehydrogenase